MKIIKYHNCNNTYLIGLVRIYWDNAFQHLALSTRS